MKRNIISKRNFLPGCVAVAILLTVSVMVRADDSVVKDELDLENGIIINGLTMESDNPPVEVNTEHSGEIVYDDSFDDSFTVASAGKKAGKKRISTISLIDRLKKKDSRWHLTTYTIKKNDNLWNIAEKFETNHRLILRANPIKNPDHLLPGKTINVPNRRGCYHHVKKGDTVSEIARYYRVDSGTVITSNSIRKDVIRTGQKLFIPDARERVCRSMDRKPAALARKGQSPSKGLSRQSVKIARQSFSWPLRGRITSGFGTRRDPFDGKRKFHCGIDISANEGTRVKAACNGTVIFSGWKDGYGKVVILRHGNGYITVYAHNSKNMVEQGENVKEGQVIALSGQTGATTGAHLHFEIRKYLTPLNPLRLL